MVIINKPKTKKAASRLFEINVFIPTKALNLVTTLCYIISITYNGFSQKILKECYWSFKMLYKNHSPIMKSIYLSKLEMKLGSTKFQLIQKINAVFTYNPTSAFQWNHDSVIA